MVVSTPKRVLKFGPEVFLDLIDVKQPQIDQNRTLGRFGGKI